MQSLIFISTLLMLQKVVAIGLLTDLHFFKIIRPAPVT